MPVTVVSGLFVLPTIGRNQEKMAQEIPESDMGIFGPKPRKVWDKPH